MVTYKLLNVKLSYSNRPIVLPFVERGQLRKEKLEEVLDVLVVFFNCLGIVDLAL